MLAEQTREDACPDGKAEQATAPAGDRA